MDSARKETKICFFTPLKWTKIIGYVQLILSAVNFLCGSGYILKEADGGAGTGNTHNDGQTRSTIVLLLIHLVASTATGAAALLLLVGNRQKRIHYLWIWMAATGLTLAGEALALGVIGGFLFGIQATLGHVALSLGLHCIFMCIVFQRVQEIKSGI